MLKDFLNNVSIYGVLPLLGKFSGFLLLPIYTRSFSTLEFGVLELILSLIGFVIYFISLEIYTSLGRYFYEKKLNQAKLISTGFWLTLLIGITICSILYFNIHIIEGIYINSNEYTKIIQIAIIWMFFDALSTYLSVIPRYENKPKKFIVISFISLFIKIITTIYFVVYLNTGIIGVLYGHLIGSIVSFINYYALSYKKISISFDIEYAKLMFKYALPLVPGVLILGFWGPLSRDLIAKNYSLEHVGVLSVALRIGSITELLNAAIKMAWNPMLFENMHKENFKHDLKKLSSKIAIIGLLLICFIALFSKYLFYIFGTDTYELAIPLIGLICFKNFINILSKVRGVSPYIDNKTYFLSFIEIISILFGVLFIYFANDSFGILGIAIFLIIPSIIKYILLIYDTEKKLGISFFSYIELILLILFMMVTIINVFYINIIIIAIVLLVMGKELKKAILN
jgi:O-antigen/teichoic acid export membrane protein